MRNSTHRALAARMLLLPLVLLGCERKADAPPAPARPVLSIVVEPTSDELLVRFMGTVQPRYQTQLGFQTDGRMISRQVNVGDKVTKGQQLATLDPTLARLAVVKAQATLQDAQATLTNAIADNGRTQALFRTEAVSQAQVDSAVATRDTAQARVNQAQAMLVKAQEGFRYTALESQYDGVVASWSVEVGQVVTAGQTVVTIAQLGERDAVFDIPESSLSRFQPDARFPVSLLAASGMSAIGVVREVSPELDAATRTRRTRLTLNAPSASFRLGTTVSLALTSAAPAKIRVPVSAVLDRDGKSLVWIVSADKKAVTRPVSLGAVTADRVEIASGLSAGDRVIIAGVHSLLDGQAVKLPNPQDSPA